MEQKQLELDFDGPRETRAQTGQIVEFCAFLDAREALSKRREEEKQAKLLMAIVRSVEHITDRSSEAEAM